MLFINKNDDLSPFSGENAVDIQKTKGFRKEMNEHIEKLYKRIDRQYDQIEWANAIIGYTLGTIGKLNELIHDPLREEIDENMMILSEMIKKYMMMFVYKDELSPKTGENAVDIQKTR